MLTARCFCFPSKGNKYFKSFPDPKSSITFVGGGCESLFLNILLDSPRRLDGWMDGWVKMRLMLVVYNARGLDIQIPEIKDLGKAPRS